MYLTEKSNPHLSAIRIRRNHRSQSTPKTTRKPLEEEDDDDDSLSLSLSVDDRSGMFGSRFSLFGGGGGGGAEGSAPGSSVSGGRSNRAGDRDSVSEPILRLRTDKDVYRPGDSVVVTIEAVNPSDRGVSGANTAAAVAPSAVYYSLLIERLGFELRGIEKLDTQWFATPKPPPGSRQRRGEYVFMECSTPSLVSNQIVSFGASKTYMVRTVLPDVIPPSYKGATIRYLYYVKCTLSGRWLIMENGISRGELTNDIVNLEIRSPLQIWVTQKSNGLVMEEGQIDGIVPGSAVQLDLYWKEMDGDSEWIRANETEDGVEEGYESSRDEVSSISSYIPGKETIHRTFGSSLSLQSSAARSTKEGPFQERTRASLSSLSLPRLSVAEVLRDSTDTSVPDKSADVVSPNQQQMIMKMASQDDMSGVVPSSPGAGRNELAASEGFIRGRSYNIRMDDQVMLRFSPKNSDSTYYFSDMIGGTLTFFHEEGTRRCLEVSITLETSETINQPSVHPSRRNSPIITKVQSDHHEVVADLVQTSFLFSVPMDGPMSFSTSRVSVQWVLRFEFFTTPRNVDWRRFEHPLLVEGRDKCEWVLPITVHAPPPGTAAAKNERPFSLEPLWVRT